MMVIKTFLPQFLVWLDGKWPFVHVRRGRLVQPSHRKKDG